MIYIFGKVAIKIAEKLAAEGHLPDNVQLGMFLDTLATMVFQIWCSEDLGARCYSDYEGVVALLVDKVGELYFAGA